jgi:hypothetical protein
MVGPADTAAPNPTPETDPTTTSFGLEIPMDGIEPFELRAIGSRWIVWKIESSFIETFIKPQRLFGKLL